MSLNDQYFKKTILDLVIMNDDLCFHTLTGPDGQRRLSFVMRDSIVIPPTDKKEMDVFVRCPICKRPYPEAAKRFKKEMEQGDDNILNPKD